MIEELAAKQSRLVNRSKPLLLKDNARPRSAQQTAVKLEELQTDFLRHPPHFRIETLAIVERDSKY